MSRAWRRERGHVFSERAQAQIPVSDEHLQIRPLTPAQSPAQLDLYVTVMAWDDFPRWFTLACLLTLPVQVWLGWWLVVKRGTSEEK